MEKCEILTNTEDFITNTQHREEECRGRMLQALKNWGWSTALGCDRPVLLKISALRIKCLKKFNISTKYANRVKEL